MYLKEFIKFKNGRKRPKSIGNIPVYGGNGILGYTNENNANNIIIIGRVGAYCGSVNISEKPCWVSDNAIIADVKGNANLKYMYYLLKMLRLNERRIGTSQPLLTQEILNNINYNIPNINIQNKVAYILQIIDEKFELNNKINKNLAA